VDAIECRNWPEGGRKGRKRTKPLLVEDIYNPVPKPSLWHVNAVHMQRIRDKLDIYNPAGLRHSKRRQSKRLQDDRPIANLNNSRTTNIVHNRWLKIRSSSRAITRTGEFPSSLTNYSLSYIAHPNPGTSGLFAFFRLASERHMNPHRLVAKGNGNVHSRLSRTK